MGEGAVHRAVRRLLALVILIVAGATVAPFFEVLFRPVELFQHFSAQLAAVALLSGLAALALGMRRWALVAAVALVWHAVALMPFLLGPRPAPVAGTPLKVLSLNLWNRNPDPAKTVDFLLKSGADVIGTVETTESWRAKLKPLETVYPYHVDCVKTVRSCAVAIFSKHPITAFQADRVDDRPPVVVSATIDWEGRPLTIAELQLLDPLIGLRHGYQARQAARATDYFSRLPGDLVVMGDFNSAPWSDLQDRFRAMTGLDNRGRLAFTWPSWAPVVFRLPIDQIFSRGAVAVRDFHAGPAIGSDHLPVIAELYRTKQE